MTNWKDKFVRKQYHIIDRINIIDTHKEAMSEINKLRSIDVERLRKINLIGL
jgi:hypothetical protein